MAAAIRGPAEDFWSLYAGISVMIRLDGDVASPSSISSGKKNLLEQLEGFATLAVLR